MSSNWRVILVVLVVALALAAIAGAGVIMDGNGAP